MANAGFNMCGNGLLKRKNKLSQILETSNSDLKSVAIKFICENPRSASAELIRTVCYIRSNDAKAGPTCEGLVHILEIAE
jgi:CRISPR/Cas system-associated protein Csm6